MTTVATRVGQRSGIGRDRPIAPPLPRLVLLTWLLLLVNVLSPSGNPTIVGIPKPVFQVVAQGSLAAALVLALLANRRLVVRPNLFLTLLTVLALISLAVSLHNEFFLGSVYRAVRLLGFVAVLWLLTPWWGSRTMVLLRAHRVGLWLTIGLVVLGAAVSPGLAFAFEGRLSGTIWPVPPTQVAHYAAVLLGTSVVLWMCGVITGRHTLVSVVVTVAVLGGTHTRTAIVGVIVGVALAGASLFLGHARVRRLSVSAIVTTIIGVALFAPQIVHYLARGQTIDQAAKLTGRTQVWSDVFAAERPWNETLFGAGLSNKSFQGLAIDSNWVASYQDQGWFGIVIQASVLLLLLALVATHVRGPRRAVALFLVAYVVVASVTETGLGDASPYLLDLFVAASLLATPARRADG